MTVATQSFDRNCMFKHQIQSKLDLYSRENLAILKKSILVWKRTHKFLSSRIVKLGDKGQLYYQYIDDQDASYKLENVKFLRLKGQKNVSPLVYQTVSGLLFDRSMADEINPAKDQNRLLWNLYLFEVDRKNHVYDFIFNYHAIIAQGISTILSFYTFMHIFEKLYKKEPLEIRNNIVFPGCESLFAFAKDFKNEPIAKIYRFKVPSFFDKERAKSIALSQQPPDYLDMQAKLINVDSGETFDTLSRLFNESRSNHIKFKKFFLEENLSSKLILKCKSEGAKFNSCLEIAYCLAFLKWYKKHGKPGELEQLCYYVIVDLRKYVEQEVIDDFTLGLCTGGLLNYPDMSELDKINSNSEYMKAHFWSTVKKTSSQLHERLKSDNSKFFPNYNALLGDLNYHFFISNIGFQGTPTQFDFLSYNFEEILTNNWVDSERMARLFSIYTATTSKGHLTSILGYNAHVIEPRFVDDLVYLFKNIVHNILD